MIQGQTNTEANYRAVMLDSSSSLKDFSLDRKKYHRKYVLNEPINEKENITDANIKRIFQFVKISLNFSFICFSSPSTFSELLLFRTMYL